MNAQHSTSNAQLSTNGNLPRVSAAVKYDLEERLLEYSALIILVVEKLPNSRSGNHIAGQLLRCGTSPLPNHGEAQAAESAADFIHKMSICLKELRETRRWLRLTKKVWESKCPVEINFLLSETEELIKIFSASICTAKENKTKQKAAPSPTLKVER
ncbi:MAG: four helix bundle protein [Limisphaerales bacterium]